MFIKGLMVVLCVYALSTTAWAKDDIVFTDDEDDGYYWRDYTNKIPKDALPGGRSVNGKFTYIGQVLHKEQLIPAKIETDPKRVTYEWGYQEFVAEKNIKILCTRNPKNFQWLSTTFTTFLNDVKDKQPVSGGYEENANLYIGRKLLDGEIAVGKVISTKLQTTLNTSKDRKGFQHGEFDVLLYNPVKWVPDMDVRNGAPTTPCNTKLLTVNVFKEI